MKFMFEEVSVIENKKRADLRTIKTEKALDIAIYELLRKRNYRKITVNDICIAAMISRAAFYAHYSDKYELLKNWLVRISPKIHLYSEPYEYIEKAINEFIFENKSVIKNIVNDADQGTLDILFQIVLTFLNFETESDKLGSGPEQVVLHNIYAGGILSYITWQVKHNFPENVNPMNKYLYKALKRYQDISSE